MKQLRLLLPVLVIFIALPAVSGQKLAKDAMVANWNFSLKAETDIEEFEKFLVQEYIPALEKSYTGVKFLPLKNDRGSSEGGYSVLLIFKSIEARNEFWPEEGKSTDKAKEAAEKMKKQAEKFQSMINIDSWNDWLVL